MNITPEVQDITCDLKKVVSGVDNITAAVLKIANNDISGPLANLINISFTQGIFPDL